MRSIADWWKYLKAFTSASVVGPEREAVEAYLETTAFKDLVQFWESSLTNSYRSRYPQIVRGGGFPKDRPDQKNINIKLPAGMDYQLDEWEGPGQTFGWTLRIFVTEALRKWQLTLNRREKFGWSKVEKVEAI